MLRQPARKWPKTITRCQLCGRSPDEAPYARGGACWTCYEADPRRVMKLRKLPAKKSPVGSGIRKLVHAYGLSHVAELFKISERTCKVWYRARSVPENREYTLRVELEKLARDTEHREELDLHLVATGEHPDLDDDPETDPDRIAWTMTGTEGTPW